MSPLRWPRLSVAGAILPAIRDALVTQGGATGAAAEREVMLCPIVEDGLLGYELAPSGLSHTFVIIGCSEDGIPRLRQMSFDPMRETGLSLATIHGRAVTGSRPARVPRRTSHPETLYADWRTAAIHAWRALIDVGTGENRQWEASMAACRSLENALTIASLHLAAWDPLIDFCGIPNQMQLGLPLHGAAGQTGILISRRPDAWTLQWRAEGESVNEEWSTHRPLEAQPGAASA